MLNQTPIYVKIEALSDLKSPFIFNSYATLFPLISAYGTFGFWWRATPKRKRRLFQSTNSHSYEISKFCRCLFQIATRNYRYDIIVLYVPELLVICCLCTFSICLLI